MNFKREYLSSLKNVEIEELSDLFFFRPLAFLLVQVLKPFPITPNQISFGAMLIGIAGGILLSFGTPQFLILGGICAGLSNVVDCSDGMIARLKGTGTKTGRIIDGVVDYVVGLAVYSGLAIGLQNALENGSLDLPYNPWLLVILAAISAALHSFLTDNYRNAYETYVFGKKLNPQDQVSEFSEELERLQRENGSSFDKFIVRYYLKYSKLQSGSSKEKFDVDAKTYRRYNRITLLLWNLIGPTTHITMMMISLFLYEPLIFFVYTIVFANIWMMIMIFIQAVIYRKMKEASSGTQSEE